jgi:hypothetical protein
MRTIRTFIRSVFLALLTILAISLITASAPAAAPDDTKDPLFPGAKLVHKFPKEVYRVPVFVTTDKGPRLEIWFDAFDPNPPPKPGMIPGTYGVPDPKLDMLIWDPIANKELHKLAYPKDPLVFPAATGTSGLNRWMAISPDGKRLASQSANYKPPKQGVVYGGWTTQIKVLDIDSHKATLISEYKEEQVGGATEVHLLFAPDGALIALRGTTCTVYEPGKEKPRTTFELTRSANWKKDWVLFSFQDAIMSPDGSQLALAVDGTIIIYELATGKKLFEATRAVPEPKGGGDLYTVSSSLVYAPSASEPKLLAAEMIVARPSGGLGQKEETKKPFVLVRQFDLKEMKETSKATVGEKRGDVSAYFTAKGEPRVLYDGKIIDGEKGKELYKFDPGAGAYVSRDGKALVRTIKKKKDDRTMTVEVWSLENDK